MANRTTNRANRLRYKLIYMAIISAPLVFHLLLVGGGTLLSSAQPSAATSSDVARYAPDKN